MAKKYADDSAFRAEMKQLSKEMKYPHGTPREIRARKKAEKQEQWLKKRRDEALEFTRAASEAYVNMYKES